MIRLPHLFVASLLLSAAAFAGSDVSVPHFTDLRAHSGANVKLVYGPTQRVTVIKGDLSKGHIEVKDGRTLDIAACSGFCWGDHRLDVEVVTPRVESVGVDSGADVKASGNFPKQPHLSVHASSGGDVDVKAIPAESVDANANSGGDAYVQALSTLNANANSGGDVHYSGHPAHVNSQSNSGGGVSAD